MEFSVGRPLRNNTKNHSGRRSSSGSPYQMRQNQAKINHASEAHLRQNWFKPRQPPTQGKKQKKKKKKKRRIQCNISERSQQEDDFEKSLWPAYNLVFPIVLTTGVAGNLMNLMVLTRPVLHGVTYVYLTGLAVADLLVMVASVTAVMRYNSHHNLPFHTAFYHANIELVLTNSFMAASVFIVCFMTLDRYFSVCRPSEFKNYHTRKNAQLAILFSYLFGFAISTPLAALKTLCTMGSVNNTSMEGLYSYQENTLVTNTTTWRIYLWVCEPTMRIVPAITLALLNYLIIKSFRKLARRQRKRRNEVKFRHRSGTNERQSVVRYRLYKEERRLVHLLTAIIITFFLTMTPAAALSIIYTDYLDNHFGFQIFRAVANILELSNFALNFFLYCFCSKQFRVALVSLFVQPKVVQDEAIEITTKNGTSGSR